MSDKDQKLAIIEAARGPLKNELYSAELDLKLAKKSKDKALRKGPEERVKELKEKLEVLDKEEAKLG